MEKALQSTNVPKQVTEPFVEMIRSISADTDFQIPCHTCPKVAEAIDDQHRIGKHLMLRGFVSNKCRTAIEHHTKVRASSKSAQLISSLWKTYFLPIWNQQNSLLHQEGSFAIQREHETLNATLRVMKENHRSLMHHSQYHLVEYTEDNIDRWGIDTKREMVSLLVAARLSYNSLLQKGDRRQSVITDYWK